MSSSYLTKALRNTFLNYITFLYLFLIAFAIIIFPLKKNTYSLELKLIWKYYKKDQISGYKIFCREEGQNYDYSSPFLEVTDPNFTTCSISGLQNNITYCFVSRAYNIYNKESFNSNEVCYPFKECTAYEDAEDGNIDGWIIYDQDPYGASISNVFDKNRQSRVIELLGISKDFIYLLQDVDWNKWNNSDQFVARWSMQFSKYFIVYFDVNTTAGDKYLYYTAVDYDRLGDARFIHHGLGSGASDGQWHSFGRDLQADLEEAQPGVSILQVNGFMVFGSGRVDDIKLCNASTDTNDIPVNTPPIAENQSISVDEDTAIDITLTASDKELDPLTYTVVTQPIHGTLSGTAPNLTYLPYADHDGSDMFTFKANDGQEDSNVATVSITIDPVNDPPITNDQEFFTDEDVSINKTLTASDIDGDELIFTIVTNGSKGNAIITNPSNGAFTYTPDINVHGIDSFGFRVNDGTTDSEIKTATINIISVNDAPVAEGQSLNSDKNASISIFLTGTDADGDILTYTLFTQPIHGTLSGTTPNLIYTPNLDYTGSDSFCFKVNDGTADSNMATVSITIDPLLDDILKECTAYEDAEDSNIDGWIIYDQDPYGASISNVFDKNRQSRVIELLGISKDFIYLLQDMDWNKWNNSDQFVARWSMQFSKYFIVYFDVNTTAGDKYLYYTAADYDRLGNGRFIHHGLGSGASDGQWHSFERDLQADLEEAQPGVSILQVNGFMVFGGGRVDDIKLCNASTSTDTNDIPVNTPPVAENQSISVDEDTAIDITLTASDKELDPLTYTVVSQPIHGTLSGTTPNLIYTPNLDYTGSDSFCFKVNDGTADSNMATVSITIDPLLDDILKECTAYEDAEDDNIDGWIIYDQDPYGASISNVFDKNRQSRVIELLGISKDFIYLLQDMDWNKWNNSDQFVACWSMQFSKYFIVYFDVNTTAGDKYLYYTAVDYDRLGNGRFIHHGLGSGASDGQWHSFERDLQADLEEAQPGVSILQVNGFMVFGGGRVDDIKLCNTIQY